MHTVVRNLSLKNFNLDRKQSQEPEPRNQTWYSNVRHRHLNLRAGCWHLGFFFLKIYFYYFFIGKADIQRGDTERKIFRPMIHSPSERNGRCYGRSEARSLFRISHVGAGSQSFGPSSTAFPGPQAGSWKGSGAAGIRTGTHVGSRACKARTLTTCATAPGHRLNICVLPNYIETLPLKLTLCKDRDFVK